MSKFALVVAEETAGIFQNLLENLPASLTSFPFASGSSDLFERRYQERVDVLVQSLIDSSSDHETLSAFSVSRTASCPNSKFHFHTAAKDWFYRHS